MTLALNFELEWHGWREGWMEIAWMDRWPDEQMDGWEGCMHG